MTSRQGIVPMRAKARLVRTLLGDEMVSNEVVAIIELVKNAYDADAKRVSVYITPQSDQIMVVDDGHGMSHSTMLEVFTSPATLYKQKRTASRRGRTLLGNKGIGRFASFRLGGKLTITSRWLEEGTEEPASTETELEMDWAALVANDELFLDEMNCRWEERDPVTFDGETTGTVLVVNQLAKDFTWDYKHVEALREGLARLLQPGENLDFQIELLTPIDDLNGLVEAPDYLRNPDYWVRAEVDQLGRAELTFRFRGSEEETSSVSLYIFADPHNQRRKNEAGQLKTPVCGPFELDMRVWDRDRDALQEKADRFGVTTRQLRSSLDRMSGMSVYRDGFRVFPYGEAGNDWLRLDLRRVQNPTMRLSNNQIIGVVRIGLERNPLLKDQSNREGFIHNEAVDDFRQLILQIIAQLEERRYKSRRKPEPEKPQGLFEGLDLQFLRRELAAQKLEVSESVQSLLDRQESVLAARLKTVQESYTRYRRLSGLGELLDKMLHETANPVGLILGDADTLEHMLRDQPNLVQPHRRVLRIQNNVRRISHALDLIKPLAGRRRTKRTPVELEAVIAKAFEFQEKMACKVDLPDTHHTIIGNEGDLLQLFDNLIKNSLYWLAASNSNDPRISIKVNALPQEGKVEILFCDNGPGVEEHHRDLIFLPHWTRKPEGQGLGLMICGEIVTEHNGILELLHDEEEQALPGACFRITLGVKE